MSDVSDICSAVEQEFISDLFNNDVLIQPESFSICLINIGKNLSSSSLLPSVANPNQCAIISSFMSFITFFATVPVKICEVLVLPHLYMLAICESGNIDLKSLDIYSVVASGRLCSTKNPEKSTSALIACFSKGLAEDHVQFVNLFCPFVASQYSLCFGVAIFFFISFSPPCPTLKSERQNSQKPNVSHLRDCLIKERLSLHLVLKFKRYFFFILGAGAALHSALL